MKGVYFIPFPKPPKDRIKKKDPKKAAEMSEKCRKWIHACGRPKDDFNESRITRNTYICSKHFVGENGPTDENPNPIPATKVSAIYLYV